MEVVLAGTDDDNDLGGRVIVVDSSSNHNNNKSTLHQEDKAQEIRDCLQLHEGSGTVDLWELRQLALSPGGLLQPSLRRVAWPLLLGLSSSSPVSPDDTSQKTESVQGLCWKMAQSEQFWYNVPLDAPAMVSSPCSSSDTTTSQADTLMDEPSEYDRALIATVLANASQAEHAPSLANLAALLVINLDSESSMASQVLARMTTYSLSAALSGAASLEQMVSVIVDQLHLQEPPSMAAHAGTWFSDGVADVQTTSRLVDAFLVSHPLFPLYFAAAIPKGEPWTMENVEAWMALGLDYMQQIPPAALVQAAKTSYVVPTTPAWALEPTVSVNWVPSKAEATPPTQQEPLSEDDDSDDGDTDGDSKWERLSALSVEAVEQQEAATDDRMDEAMLLESYPLAAMAAGMAVTTTARSLPASPAAEAGKRKVKNVGSGVLRVLLFAIVVVAYAVWSNGLVGRARIPHEATPVVDPMPMARNKRRKRPAPTKVPSVKAPPSRIPISRAHPSVVAPPTGIPTAAPVPSPPPKPVFTALVLKAESTVMAPNAATKTQQSTATTSSTPEPVKNFVLDGIAQSIEPVVEFCFECWRDGILAKPTAVTSTPEPKVKPLQALAKKVGKALDRVRRVVKNVRVVMTLGLLSVLHLIIPTRTGESN
ncbi:TBC1 domain family member 20 [Seminavis robusta]|uniref:TBC1 domain family member 20 n=1 Tax=Seminavis robusta TaxID=568900 RepID=A0A9N8EMR7_9STRA|nr:TBC1 domain family member 20 [Seminavis robusta]|eukprot:Sro1189_g250710.1 TBC1 domain family member 20 (651) ;mRNA; f:22956-25009